MHKIPFRLILIFLMLCLALLGYLIWSMDIDKPIKAINKTNIISKNTDKNTDIVIKNNDQSAKNPTQSSSESTKTPQTVVSKLLFMGDVFWGRSMNEWANKSDLKYAYPFSKLDSFDRAKYDAWIANLECPITERKMTAAEQEVGLRFTCLPEYLSEAHKYFDVFSLANNHTDNQEAINGLKTSRSFLEAEGIQYFGSFDNHFQADICEVVSLPATISATVSATVSANKSTQKTSIPVALCGYNNVFSIPTESDLKVIEGFSEYFPVIIMPHQGQEYVNKPDNIKISTYHKMIDYGADLVVGSHPHAVQSTEVYKNKLIVYSLGNFIFDQQLSTNVTRGAALDVEINFKNVESQSVANWLQLAKSCQTYKDNCLQMAKDQKIQKPEYELKYDLIGSQSDNKITRKAGSDIQAWVLNTANWAETLQKLNALKTETKN